MLTLRCGPWYLISYVFLKGSGRAKTGATDTFHAVVTKMKTCKKRVQPLKLSVVFISLVRNGLKALKKCRGASSDVLTL